MQQSTKQSTQLTPIQKLRADKECLQQACRDQKLKLSENFNYLQGNAGNLALSGVSSLLFPGSKSASNPNIADSNVAIEPSESSKTPLRIADYLLIGKSILPLAWEIAQPFLITWGLKKVRKLVTGSLAKKKK